MCEVEGPLESIGYKIAVYFIILWTGPGGIASVGECKYKNITYSDGQIFMEDLCTRCQCDNTTVTCVTETCTDCEQGTTTVNASNECCPLCLSGKTRSHDAFN